MNNEKMKKWIEENLVLQDEARSITNQSVSGFNQSVQTGYIKAFVEFGNERKTRLYLRSDIEDYAKNKKKSKRV